MTHPQAAAIASRINSGSVHIGNKASTHKSVAHITPMGLVGKYGVHVNNENGVSLKTFWDVATFERYAASR